MGNVNIQKRQSPTGEDGWLISICAEVALVQSAVIYDDYLKITYMRAMLTIYRGGKLISAQPVDPVEVVMDLDTGYRDVMQAIQVRAYTGLSAESWSFLPLSYAAGPPDLTPLNVIGGKTDDVLYGGMGADTLAGGRGDDVLHGERATDNHWVGGNDVMSGGKGSDTLDGGTGNDELIGGAGHDRLDGGAGADLIDGGAGNDVLTGGKGADIFIFHRADPGTKHSDTVTDFELGVDKIRIGDDLLETANIYPTFNHEEETLTSLTVTHLTEPNWAKLLFAYMSHGITTEELQQASAHVTSADFNTSRMTLSFDGVSAQDLTDAVHEAGSLNALLFDVI